MESRFGQLLVAGLLLAMIGRVVSAFEMIEVPLDLDPLLAAPEQNRPAAEPLFNSILVADLTGDGRKEVVLPATDGRLRVLRLIGPLARPRFSLWAAIDAVVEGDRIAGTCHFTAAPLEKGAPASLVIALPRGIFSVRIESDPAQVQWIPLCDRGFFDPGQVASRPQRLDFLADLDGDGVPEIFMPHMESLVILRRRAGGSSWQEVAVPPLAPRVRQSAGARPIKLSAAQPASYAIGFRYSLNFPLVRLTDLNGDGRLEMIIERREGTRGPALLRAECFALRDESRFSTSPTQIRTSDGERGNESFLDLNGDGFLDMLRVESNLDIVNPRTTIEVFESPPVAEHEFENWTARYVTRDPIGMALVGDWNGDGLADLGFSQFDYAFGSADDLASLLIGREITLTMRFVYRRRTGFPQKPDQDLRLVIRNDSFRPGIFPPITMDGDYDGDGISDLLVRSKPDRCDLYLSRKAGELSRRRDKSFPIPPEGAWHIADLDSDGRSDVLTFDPERKQIIAWLSR